MATTTLSYHAQHTISERASKACRKEEVPANLQALVAPHVDSFNWFINQVQQPVRMSLSYAHHREEAKAALRARAKVVNSSWQTAAVVATS